METINPKDLLKTLTEVFKDKTALQQAQRVDNKSITPENLSTLFRELGERTTKGFVIDNENKETITNLILWVANDPRMKATDKEGKSIQGNPQKGIYLSGNTGTGKSVLLNLLGMISYFAFAKDQKEDFRLSFDPIRADEICSIFAQNGAFNGLEKYKCLAIQDLGSEPTETLYMGNRISVLRQLLEQRGDQRNKFTFITSNIPPQSKEFKAKYGDRVQSRIFEMCNILTLNGKDRRK